MSKKPHVNVFKDPTLVPVLIFSQERDGMAKTPYPTEIWNHVLDHYPISWLLSLSKLGMKSNITPCIHTHTPISC